MIDSQAVARDNKVLPQRCCRLKGVRKILKHAIVSFEELIAPLSQGKLLVLVECLSIEGCEQPDVMKELAEILDMGFGSGFDDWEDFLDYGFLVIEGELTTDNETEAALLIDYLRNEKFREVVQADLFVDGLLQDSSWNGEPSIWDISSKKPKVDKSVVIRFPVEKIKRHKDSGNKK